nr:hypothetical protein [Tanacetum cinerariifolium]
MGSTCRSLNRLLTLGADQTSRRSSEVGIDSSQTGAPYGEELGLKILYQKVLATEWITLAFRLALIDTEPVLQVQHQGLSRFKIQLVEQVAIQASLLERLSKIPVRLANPQVASPPTYPQPSWM